MAAAAVGLPAGDDDGIDVQLAEHELQRCLEEAAVGLLGDDVVAGLRLKLVDDLGAFGANDRVGTPHLEFLIHLGCVAVVGVDHRHVVLAGVVAQILDRLNDVMDAGTRNGAGDEVVEHVDDDNGGSGHFRFSFFVEFRMTRYCIKHTACPWDKVKRPKRRKNGCQFGENADPPGSRTAVGGMREKKYRFCLELAALIVDMKQLVLALADVVQQRFNDGVLLAALDEGGFVGVV